MSVSQGTLVDHLGHTSFAVCRGGFRMLVDPILVGRTLEFRSPEYPEWFYPDLDQVHAVLLSHGHNDHLHPPSLLGLPGDVPIYFLNESPSGCSCDAAPRALLSGLGFRDLRPFTIGDRLELAEGVVVHTIPAQASCEGEEQCCFVMETPDILVLDAVDIRDTPITRQALRPFRGHVDLAFVPTGASLQWQGFWNQMDALEALSFCRWLEVRAVGACGGGLSFSRRPQAGSLERYPKDLADWLATASRELADGRLLRHRPPFRLQYLEHRLRHCGSLQHGRALNGGRASSAPSPLVTAFFTGYNPRAPAQRLGWADSGLAEWLGALQAAKPALEHSQASLRALLERCDFALNNTPFAVLAPSTLRHVVRERAFDLAARLSSLCPEPPAAPQELEFSFFAVAEAVVGGWPGLADPLRENLQLCLSIDRRLYHLRQVHIRMARDPGLEENRASELLAEHLAGLRRTLPQRRPVLDVNILRLDRERAPLLLGTPLAAGEAGLLCYPNRAGVQLLRLSEAEALILDLCDGRPLSEFTGEISRLCRMRESDVEEAVFSFLARLSQVSILLIDWSQ